MKYSIILYSLICMCLSVSCKKYLDAKSDKSVVVASQVLDYQALLDNNGIMNRASPSAGEGSSDNYYLDYDNWAALYNEAFKNIYIWGDEITYDLFPNDWGQAYDQIYFCNTVIEGLKTIEQNDNNVADWNNAEGSAFFFRANAYLKLVLTWAAAYDSTTAAADLGVPLRLKTDFNEVSVRASVKDCYERIINDGEQAVRLLPVNALFTTRPSKKAAYGLMARAYLAMRNYHKAGLYADSCLQLYNTTMDYNALDSTAAYPIPAFNDEVLFYAAASAPELSNSIANVDTALFASYSDNDLRKTIFFNDKGNGKFKFRGSYNGNNGLFTGIATDEIYLIRSECYVREGKIDAALDDLNALLSKRWKHGTYIYHNTDNTNDALTLILGERRKELPFRDLRWMDIKRLNKEQNRQIILKRSLNGTEYTLQPNDPKYALPLPQSVIQLTGMPQNPR